MVFALWTMTQYSTLSNQSAPSPSVQPTPTIYITEGPWAYSSSGRLCCFGNGWMLSQCLASLEAWQLIPLCHYVCPKDFKWHTFVLERERELWKVFVRKWKQVTRYFTSLMHTKPTLCYTMGPDIVTSLWSPSSAKQELLQRTNCILNPCVFWCAAYPFSWITELFQVNSALQRCQTCRRWQTKVERGLRPRLSSWGFLNFWFRTGPYLYRSAKIVTKHHNGLKNAACCEVRC